MRYLQLAPLLPFVAQLLPLGRVILDASSAAARISLTIGRLHQVF
jgi:hypothetical protein